MRIYVSGSQQGYFATHHSLEILDMFADINYPLVLAAVNLALEERITPPFKESIFLKGRDLWRDSGLIKKILSQRDVGEVAAQLIEQRPLRLAFSDLVAHPQIKQTFFDQWPKNIPLKDWVAFQGPVIGALVEFDQEDSKLRYLSGEFRFTEELKKEYSGKLVMLAVYTDISGRYVNNTLDPLSSHFRRLGLSRGDKFKDNLFPIVVR